MPLTDHKPRTGDPEPLTRKEVKEACKNPMVQTKIKLRSKWRAPITYKVLQVFQLSKQDRKEVSKTLVQAITPDKARRAILGKVGWMYRGISLVKDHDVGLLVFKGLAVCLFYKRQFSEIEPIATDPIPLGSLEDDDDIWARLDLFSKSPRELHATVGPELVELNNENTELKYQVKVRDTIIESLEQKVVALQEQIKSKEQLEKHGKEDTGGKAGKGRQKGKQARKATR
jgi:hypothetical protein